MDRKTTITISTAKSRFSKSWSREVLTIAEFVERLSHPAVIGQCFADFMALSKDQQLNLKDVGGYVAGTLSGTRRKSGTVTARNIITLDYDELNPRDADTIVGKIENIYNYAAVIHSTAKHTPAAPRLRVLIFPDRLLSADEYEPCARRIAEQLGFTGVDPASFEDERLMFYPAHCKDGEVVFVDTTARGVPVDVDATLKSYTNGWQNPAEWPRSATETIPKPSKIRNQKPENPLMKPGTIGAFCRAYAISEAIKAFLDGVYIPFADTDDRYTYANGSSAGGVVIYDGDTLLYSHHQTDPANTGSCVNAFDLVRLHKFGELDADVKEITPINKRPSFIAMCEFANADERVQRQRALDDFSGAEYEGVTDTGKTALAGLNGKPLTIDTMQTLLGALGVVVRYNQITHGIDISGLSSKYSPEQAVNHLPTELHDYAKTAGMKNVSRDAIPAYVAAVADLNRYNPVADLLDNITWDGIDRFDDLCSVLGIESAGLYAAFVRRWLIGAAAIVRNDDGKQSLDGVLTLQGKQGCGKTSFFRNLFPAPLASYFKEGASLDVNNKDSISQATGVWCTELGELDSTLAREQTALKAFITNAWDEYRAPYARAAVKHPRRTTFCGTVNDERFLKDPTGNRRFWVVPVERIDLDKMANLGAPFFMQLWAQADALARADQRAHRLTKFEMVQLEKANQKYADTLPGEEELLSIFDFELPGSAWSEYSAGGLCGHYHYGIILKKYSARQIGRALKHVADNNPQITRRTLHGVALYRIPVPSAATADFKVTS